MTATVEKGHTALTGVSGVDLQGSLSSPLESLLPPLPQAALSGSQLLGHPSPHLLEQQLKEGSGLRTANLDEIIPG